LLYMLQWSLGYGISKIEDECPWRCEPAGPDAREVELS
jgi:hypothetical protein